MMIRFHTIVASLTLLPTFGLAQTAIDPSSKFSWSENAGFMNWADAGDPLGSSSVLIEPSYLHGYVWCENVGWLKLGAGEPADGIAYANATGLDWGVNYDSATGRLSGLGWGENVGWVNFSGGSLASPPNPARLDADANRLRGYAWGENVGWINLDDGTIYVGTLPPPCYADYNQDGGIDGADVEAFFADWEAGLEAADVNADGGIDGADVEVFFAAWEAGGC